MTTIIIVMETSIVQWTVRLTVGGLRHILLIMGHSIHLKHIMIVMVTIRNLKQQN